MKKTINIRKLTRDLNEKTKETEIQGNEIWKRDRDIKRLEEENKAIQTNLDNLLERENNFLRGMVVHLTSKSVEFSTEKGEKTRSWRMAGYVDREFNSVIAPRNF